MALPEKPITRIEKYLSAWAGEGETPQNPITREEMYLDAIVNGGEAPTTPITRSEKFYDAILKGETDLSCPITRKEQYLYAIATGGEKPSKPITRIEMYLNEIDGGGGLEWIPFTENEIGIIYAVAIASGITFLSDGMTESGLTEYIGQQLQQYATDIGTTVSDWWDGIGSISKRDNGQVVISNPTYNAIQNFISWLKGKNNISNAGDTSTVISSAASSITSLAGVTYPIYEWSEAGGNYVNPPAGVEFFSLTANSNPIEFNGFSISHSYTNSSGQVTYRFISGDYSHTSKPAGGQYGLFFYSNNGVIGLALNSQYNYASVWIPNLTSYLSHSLNSSLSVSQPASYDALELQDGESVALDLGATVEAGATLEDILAEYLAKIVDNTATATQRIA